MVEPPSSNDNPTRLDSSICDALSGIDGVDGSFAIATRNSTLEPASAPGTAATAFAVSPGVYEFLGAGPVDGAAVILTQGANDLTGLVNREVSLLTAKPFDDSTAAGRAFATVVTADTAMLSDQHQGVYLVPELLRDGADACYVRTHTNGDLRHLRCPAPSPSRNAVH